MTELRPLIPRTTVPRKRHPLQTEKPVAKVGKKSLSGTLIASGIFIFIVCFSMGMFPQINGALSNANAGLQSYNNQIVTAIITNLPAALITIGILGLSFLTINSLRARGSRA